MRYGPVFLMLALLGSGAAEARMIIDDVYSLEVPAGWLMTSVDENFIKLISPDKRAVFLITHGLSMPRHREKVADLVKEYDYLRIGAPDRLATLMRVNNLRVAVTIVGDHPDRVSLYRSIEAAPRSGGRRDVWQTKK